MEMRPIPGWPGYQATDDGRIWSDHKHGFLIGEINGKYRRHYVNITRDGRSRMRQVHCLILETFIGPCPPGMECRHLDGNALNNNLSNLKWGTKKENAQDTLRHGHHFHCEFRGVDHPMVKLTEAQVLEIRRRCHTVPKRRGIVKEMEHLAAEYGVSYDCVRKVLYRERWRHVA